jgi:hypothetical protein
MMTTSVPTFPRPSPFSHLARNPAASAASDVPPNKPTDDDEDDDQDDDQDEADDESGDGKKTKKKKSKAKKKAEDDSDDSDDKKPDARAARAREKARIRAIVTSDAGLRFPSAALQIALGGSTPRHAAVQMLAAMTKDAAPASASGRDSLRDRMAGERSPEVGSGGDERPAANLAQMILAADRKRRGEI